MQLSFVDKLVSYGICLGIISLTWISYAVFKDNPNGLLILCALVTATLSFVGLVSCVCIFVKNYKENQVAMEKHNTIVAEVNPFEDKDFLERRRERMQNKRNKVNCEQV